MVVALSQCHQSLASGKRCKAHPRVGDQFCFFHSPDTAQHRKNARIAGGVSRSKKAAVLPLDTANVSVRSSTEVCHLLAQTIGQVRCGQLDARIANCVGHLAGILLRGLEQGKVEERLARIEVTLGIATDHEKEMLANAN